MPQLKEKIKLPKVLTKLDFLENENIYFEDINKFDKFVDSLENMEK